MNKNKLLLAVILTILIMFSASVNAANAAQGWYDQCDIIATGTQDGRAIIRLQGGASNLPLNWYILGESTSESNQLLAIVLAALSQGATTIGVTVDPSDGYWPVIRTVVMWQTF